MAAFRLLKTVQRRCLYSPSIRSLIYQFRSGECLEINSAELGDGEIDNSGLEKS